MDLGTLVASTCGNWFGRGTYTTLFHVVILNLNIKVFVLSITSNLPFVKFVMTIYPFVVK